MDAPQSYHQAILDGFAYADDEITGVINNYLPYFKGVHSTTEVATITSTGLSVPVSHFNPVESAIYMDETKTTEEYMRTFRHEFGHFIDSAMGNASESKEFCDAFSKDASLYDLSNEAGIARLREMQLQITENVHAFASEYVTDIISALTHNDTVFIQSYIENAVQATTDDPFYYEKIEGAGMSGHSNSYWFDGPYLAETKEVFADLFAIRVENNPIVQEFIRDFFPNLHHAFNHLMMDRTIK